MGFFDSVGKGSVEEAHSTVREFLDRIQPIVDEVVLRLEGVVHGILNRFEIDIKIKLNPPPKAEGVSDNSK